MLKISVACRSFSLMSVAHILMIVQAVTHEWFALGKLTESCTPKQLANLGKLFMIFTLETCRAVVDYMQVKVKLELGYTI